MTEPDRLNDDETAPPELRALLRGARKARPLSAAVRERGRARLARVATLPLTAVGWLSVKTAVAAFSVGCGTAVLAAIVIAPRATPHSVPPAAVSVRPALRKASAARFTPVPVGPASAETSAPPVEAVTASPTQGPQAVGEVAVFPRQQAAAPSAAEQRAPERPDSSNRATSANSLAAESELLERARSVLRRAPLEALRLAREHAETFPRAQLGSERALIELEALHRLGRDAEAQTLAHALLARNADDLYVERVHRLLGELSLD